MDKVGTALGTLRFHYQCSDRSTTPEQLFRNNKFVLLLQPFRISDDI